MTLQDFTKLTTWAKMKLYDRMIYNKPIRDFYGRDVEVCYDHERVMFEPHTRKPWVAFVVGAGEATGESQVLALVELRLNHPELFTKHGKI